MNIFRLTAGACLIASMGSVPGMIYADELNNMAERAWRWELLLPAFAQNLDAAVGMDEDWVAYISGNEIVYYPLYPATSESLYMRKLQDIQGWPDDWASIDAAAQASPGRHWYFRGDEYLVYDIDTDSIVDRIELLPSTLPANWNGGVDAALGWGPNSILLLRYGHYVLLNFEENTITDAQALSAWQGWPEAWQSVDAALDTGYPLAYFFHKGNFLPYSDEGDGSFLPGFPLAVGAAYEGTSEINSGTELPETKEPPQPDEW